MGAINVAGDLANRCKLMDLHNLSQALGIRLSGIVLPPPALHLISTVRAFATSVEAEKHRSLSSKEMSLSSRPANNPDSASFAMVHCLCCSIGFESQVCTRHYASHKALCEDRWDFDNLKCSTLKQMVIKIQQRWHLRREGFSQVSHDLWS